MIQHDVKRAVIEAMKAKDEVRLNTLRMLSAGFTNELVATGKKPTDDLPDEDALQVIRREVKKRKEAAEAFRGGGRPELAEKEDAERVILEAYLPQMMSPDDIRPLAQAKMVELGITDKAKAGMLVGALMKDFKGKADGGDVKTVVDGLFK